jgi:hypothetical protein
MNTQFQYPAPDDPDRCPHCLENGESLKLDSKGECHGCEWPLEDDQISQCSVAPSTTVSPPIESDNDFSSLNELPDWRHVVQRIETIMEDSLERSDGLTLQCGSRFIKLLRKICKLGICTKGALQDWFIVMVEKLSSSSDILEPVLEYAYLLALISLYRRYTDFARLYFPTLKLSNDTKYKREVLRRLSVVFREVEAFPSISEGETDEDLLGEVLEEIVKRLGSTQSTECNTI